MTKKKIIATSLLITCISLVGKVLGFLRETLLAGFFGTSYVVDAYLMSVYIPSILFGWIPAISAGYVPKYFEVNEKKRDKFTSNVLCCTILVALIAILFAMMLNHQIVRIVAPGFSKERFELTALYLKITIWTVLLNTPIQIMTSYLNCKERFVQSSVSVLFLSFIQAIFIVLAAKFNLVLLPFGILVAYIVQFAFLLISSIKSKFKFQCGIKIDDDIKSLFRIVVPIFISNSLVDINSFVDNFLASSLEAGSVAGLNYAFNLKAFFLLVFTTAITTMTYPKLSALIADRKEKEAGGYIENTLILVIVIFTPLTVGALVMAAPLIKCVFMHGAFDVSSLSFTVEPFVMYTIALPFLALRDVFIKILYAYKDSKANLIGGAISIALNIVLSLALVKKMGTSGLALATSLSCIISFSLYVFMLAKKNVNVCVKNVLRWIIESIMASGVMGGVVGGLTQSYLGITGSVNVIYYLKTILIIVIGVIIYFAFLLLFNCSATLEYLRNRKTTSSKKK